MSSDFFIKIDGIDGESEAEKHKKEIDVLSWSWGTSQGGNMHVAGGGGAGKAAVGDLSFVKYVDSASHLIWIKCCTGKHIKEATLTCRKAGDNPQDYLKVKLEDLLISSVSTGGSAGEAILTESVSLNFAKVTYSYWPQKIDGTLDAEKKAGYDVKGTKEM